MGPTVADYCQRIRLIPLSPTSEFCHGRGREFESRRPRHSFRKSYVDFDQTNEGAKGCIFAPFLCPQRLRVSYAPRCCKSETDVPGSTGENMSESTAACAACFAGVIACV